MLLLDLWWAWGSQGQRPPAHVSPVFRSSAFWSSRTVANSQPPKSHPSISGPAPASVWESISFSLPARSPAQLLQECSWQLCGSFLRWACQGSLRVGPSRHAVRAWGHWLCWMPAQLRTSLWAICALSASSTSQGTGHFAQGIQVVAPVPWLLGRPWPTGDPGPTSGWHQQYRAPHLMGLPHGPTPLGWHRCAHSCPPRMA